MSSLALRIISIHVTESFAAIWVLASDCLRSYFPQRGSDRTSNPNLLRRRRMGSKLAWIHRSTHQFPRENVRKISITRYEEHKSSVLPPECRPFGLFGNKSQIRKIVHNIRSRGSRLAKYPRRRSVHNRTTFFPLPHTGFPRLCLSRFQAKPIYSISKHRPATNTLHHTARCC